MVAIGDDQRAQFPLLAEIQSGGGLMRVIALGVPCHPGLGGGIPVCQLLPLFSLAIFRLLVSDRQVAAGVGNVLLFGLHQIDRGRHRQPCVSDRSQASFDCQSVACMSIGKLPVQLREVPLHSRAVRLHSLGSSDVRINRGRFDCILHLLTA